MRNRMYRCNESQFRYCLFLFLFMLNAAVACGYPAGSLEERLDNIGLNPEWVKFQVFGLQRAIGTNDREAVGVIIGFPQSYEINCEDIIINNVSDFVRYYDLLIDSTIEIAIVSAKYEDLFVSWRGAMLGRGEIWFTGTADDYTRAGEPINPRMNISLNPRKFDANDCYAELTTTSNQNYLRQISSLTHKSFLGSWKIIHELESDITCITTDLARTITESSFVLGKNRANVDNTICENMVIEVHKTRTSALLGDPHLSSRSWRRRAGLLADTTLVLTLNCQGELMILDKDDERCYVRDSGKYEFWVTDDLNLVWPLVGSYFVLQRNNE